VEYPELFVFAETCRSFFAKTFWSLKNFSHLYYSSIETRHNYSLVNISDRIDLIFFGHLKKIRSMAERKLDLESGRLEVWKTRKCLILENLCWLAMHCICHLPQYGIQQQKHSSCLLNLIQLLQTAFNYDRMHCSIPLSKLPYQFHYISSNYSLLCYSFSGCGWAILQRRFESNNFYFVPESETARRFVVVCASNSCQFSPGQDSARGKALEWEIKAEVIWKYSLSVGRCVHDKW